MEARDEAIGLAQTGPVCDRTPARWARGMPGETGPRGGNLRPLAGVAENLNSWYNRLGKEYLYTTSL